MEVVLSWNDVRKIAPSFLCIGGKNISNWLIPYYIYAHQVQNRHFRQNEAHCTLQIISNSRCNSGLAVNLKGNEKIWSVNCDKKRLKMLCWSTFWQLYVEWCRSLFTKTAISAAAEVRKKQLRSASKVTRGSAMQKKRLRYISQTRLVGQQGRMSLLFSAYICKTNFLWSIWKCWNLESTYDGHINSDKFFARLNWKHNVSSSLLQFWNDWWLFKKWFKVWWPTGLQKIMSLIALWSHIFHQCSLDWMMPKCANKVQRESLAQGDKNYNGFHKLTTEC